MKRWLVLIVCCILIGLGILFLWSYTGLAEDLRDAINVSRINDDSFVALEKSTDTTPTLTPFQPRTNTPTISSTPTVTSSKTPSKTSTPQPSTTDQPTSTVTATPTPLENASIEEIKGHWPAYSLNCEARSAVDWANYFGFQIDEIAFYNQLPVSDDPDLGFVGSVHEPWGQTPPNGYGVHADPVAKLLQEYGMNALPVHGMTWDQLRAEISQYRPVIVWVVGRVGRGTPIPYTSSEGNETVVARFEHTVIVTGYSETEVTVLDGYWVYTRSIQDFKVSWGVLGNMAVILSEGENPN